MPYNPQPQKELEHSSDRRSGTIFATGQSPLQMLTPSKVLFAPPPTTRSWAKVHQLSANHLPPTRANPAHPNATCQKPGPNLSNPGLRFTLATYDISILTFIDSTYLSGTKSYKTKSHKTSHAARNAQVIHSAEETCFGKNPPSFTDQKEVRLPNTSKGFGSNVKNPYRPLTPRPTVSDTS